MGGQIRGGGYNGRMKFLANLQDFGFEKTGARWPPWRQLFVTLYLILSANAPRMGSRVPGARGCYMVGSSV